MFFIVVIIIIISCVTKVCVSGGVCASGCVLNLQSIRRVSCLWCSTSIHILPAATCGIVKVS